MPIDVAIWNITDDKVNKVNFSAIDSERRLEEILTDDISILGDDYLIIGRQVMTSYGKYIDLLSINHEGKLTVIELKKDKTARDVVAQALDYASWVSDLSYNEVKNICEDFHTGEKFENLFEENFNTAVPEKINEEHDMLIVCSNIDNQTERILNYLSDSYNVPINVAFFRFFKEKDSEYLARSWLIDPTEVIEKSSKSKSQSKGEAWNGRDFVVNINADENGKTTWKDSRKFGFISAGGGRWYSNSLRQLYEGARVFAMIPKKGYVGVGIVIQERKPIGEFHVTENSIEKPILDIGLDCEGIKKDSDDPEKCEYMVGIDWIKTLDEDDAYWENGLRANQNSAFKLKNKFTLERLIEYFDLEE
ncbi:MAG: endonuclease NucS domain-containing protein [Candidatus Zixiibacteriota bacterium]